MIFLLLAIASAHAMSNQIIKLNIGYLTRVNCVGSLKNSAVGNSTLIQIEALPKESGCGLLLKPLKTGRTNLIVLTSSGDFNRIVEITNHRGTIDQSELEYEILNNKDRGQK